jgi:site-specific recombinase XerD
MSHSTTSPLDRTAAQLTISTRRIGYENERSQNQNGGLLIESVTQSSSTSLANVERNPALIYLAGLSESGRRSMAQKLRLVAELLGYGDARSVQWSQLRYEHVVAIRTKLSEGILSPTSVNTVLSAVRGVAKAAWSLGLLTSEDYTRIAAVKGLRGSRLPSGRALSAGEVTALFDACFDDEKAAGRRDAAILALLLGAGLRRAECADLGLSDYTPGDQNVKVRGKGDKQRLMPLGESADQAVRDWLTVRGDWSGSLLCRVRKDGAIEQQSITAQAIYKALAKRGRESRVARFSPHDLRKTYASGLIDVSGDISTVSRLLGHASVNTTSIYDRRGEVAKRKVADSLHLPYRSR